MLMEGKVRYAATTPSRAPDRHSSMNSERFLALGSRRSACLLRSFQAEWAWSMGPRRRTLGRGDASELIFGGVGVVGVDVEGGVEIEVTGEMGCEIFFQVVVRSETRLPSMSGADNDVSRLAIF